MEKSLNQSEADVREIDYRIATVKRKLAKNVPLWDAAKAVHKGPEKNLTVQGLLIIQAHL